jgi:hypothetical protein
MSGTMAETRMSEDQGGKRGRKRGSRKKVQRAIYLDEDLFNYILDLADQDERSFSQTIELLLKAQLKRDNGGDDDSDED